MCILSWVWHELLQRLVSVFHEWDEDRNGRVSRKEFEHAMALLSIEATSAMVGALFDALTQPQP